MSTQIKAIVGSYVQSILGAVAALYLAGVTDPLDLLWSLAAALIPVAIRYVNPNDPGFGIVPTPEVVEVAVAEIKPKKAPAKKPPIK